MLLYDQVDKALINYIAWSSEKLFFSVIFFFFFFKIVHQRIEYMHIYSSIYKEIDEALHLAANGPMELARHDQKQSQLPLIVCKFVELDSFQI